VALVVFVAFVAEGAGDDFAVMNEESGPSLLARHLHMWSGQQLSKKKVNIKINILLPTFLL
jgi:hypothetical protein